MVAEGKYDGVVDLFMKETKLLLSWCGVEIPGKRNFFYFVRKIFFFYCLVAHNIFLIYDTYRLRNELSFTEIVYYICYSLHYFISFSMSVQWYVIGKKFENMMQNIENAMPEDEREEEVLKTIIRRENAFKKRSCYIVGFVCCVSVGLGYIGWLVTFITDNDKYWVEQVNGLNETTYIYTQRLPYPTTVPFEYRSNKVKYFILVTLFSLPTVNYIFNICGVDSLFFSFTCYACLHFKLLKHLFKTIYERNLKKITKTNNNVTADLNIKMETDLRNLAIYLEKVLEFCTNLEENYNKVILLQTLSSISFTALSLLILMVTPMTDSTYPSEVVFTMVCLSIIFFYCYFGNRVTTTASEIPFALYECNWFSTRKGFIKSLLIIMTRMYKPIYITIGSISPITLATFVSITKTGYSFLAVFKKGKTFQKLQENGFNG